MKAIPYCVLRNPSRTRPYELRNTQYAIRSAFTLIEILVVCAIIGIIMTIAIPNIYRQLHPDSMAKAVTDFMEACSHARAFAILGGSPVDLVLDAESRRIFVQGGPTNFSATLPESVAVELIEVNFQDGMEWAEARVRFYPAGTCDQFRTLLVRHPLPGETGTVERRLITLEVMTALADVESDYSKMR